MNQFLPARRKINAGIDMTPLIDVVFQLLIFLMVSSHFVKPDYQVDLPTGEAKNVKVDQLQDKHILVITPENELLLNDAPISSGEFEAKLTALMDESGVKRLEIRGDSSSNLGTFITVLESAKALEVESLSYHKKAEDSK